MRIAGALFPLLMVVAPMCAQSPLSDARAALAANQSWRATQLLAPVLARPETRTPEAVMLAAQAAARWEGWATVRRLLEREPWLDSLFDREGHRLLAEAALAANRTDDAIASAERSLPGGDARDSVEQGHRMVLLARALDRADRRDSAAAVYARSAKLLPVVTDWLVLRAAGVTADAGTRRALLATVTAPAAAPRVPWTDALALERLGDRAGAASAYARLGARTIALRLRWEAALTPAAKRAVADSLVAQLAAGVPAAGARDALILIERLPVDVTPSERLLVARRAAQLGRAAQAADAFALAAKAAPLSSADRYAYGNVLSTLNRWPEASIQFRRVTDPALTGHAAYFHARALLRSGKAAEAVNALERVVATYPRDTVAAGTALYLLGDLALDDGKPAAAQRWLTRLATRYPTSSFAPRAALTSALIHFAAGDTASAARELTRSAVTYARSTEGDAIVYWLARTHRAAGRTAEADSLFRVLVRRGPESYYAVRAAARLDTVPWRGGAASVVPPDDRDADFRRIALLERLGLDTEARFELDALAAAANNAEALLATAQSMLERGYIARASQLANRALSAGAPRDTRTLRLLYPLPWADALRAAGAREGVDPLLAASVIRQESAFQPRATSRTDARGLMQVMPAVGRELGRGFGMNDLDPALLWQPEVNIPLGMRHFGAALKRYPEAERALAAYNAGQSRVNRWSATLLSGPRGGAVTAPLDDAELFVERIPFEETRGYVRVVLRNASMYRMLYGD